jgi:hypothetical protein
VSASRDPLTIPERDRVRCDQCGETIDAKGIGNAQAVSGWAINRGAGGANTITLPTRSAHWLCRFCVAARKRGHEWEQLGLFGS